METAKKSLWVNRRNLAYLLLGVMVMYLIITMLINGRFNELEQNTRLLIADQQSLLVAIAETTARNGADSVTESIISDCSVTERNEFDDLLGKLDSGLSHSQLSTLERLFGRCGTFYSERKSVMVSRLSREIEVYESYVNLLSAQRDENLAEAFNVSEWQALAAEERKQSEMFTDLVSVQNEIITTLLAGKSPTSPEMAEILRRAKEIQETLIVVNMQASNLRSKLVSL
jgi:hypothetical protein